MFFNNGQFPQRHQDHLRDQHLPLRVALAFRVVQHYGDELSPIVVPGNGDLKSAEEFQPRVIDVEETKLFRVSCGLLTKYIEGNYKLSAEEKRDRNMEYENDPKTQTMCRCIMCGGQGRIPKGNTNYTECQLCKGGGYLMTMPANPEGR